eukprot:1092653_1
MAQQAPASYGFQVFAMGVLKTSTLDVRSDQTIETVKKAYADKELWKKDVDWNELIFMFRGRCLGNEETVSACGLEKESTFHVRIRLHGGNPETNPLSNTDCDLSNLLSPQKGGSKMDLRPYYNVLYKAEYQTNDQLRTLTKDDLNELGIKVIFHQKELLKRTATL